MKYLKDHPVDYSKEKIYPLLKKMKVRLSWNVLNGFLSMSFLTILSVQCQQERDKYFEEPNWVGKPIYETLQDEGRFSQYLRLLDKTRYAGSLKGTGLWTVFAPNDEAVTDYLREKHYTSVEDIPQNEVEKLVSYSLLFSKYRFEQLSDVLSSGWDTLQSLKKKTLYYETIYREYNGTDSVWIVDPTDGRSYTTNDNNYKYLPFYLDRYFSTRSAPLTADDYNTFYPTLYTGKNVQGSTILQENIRSANGVVHEVNKVNEPLPNLQQILTNDDQYSDFRHLFDLRDPVTGELYFYQYTNNLTLTTYFRKMFPSLDIRQIYVKIYNEIKIPLNCERYSHSGGADVSINPETNGYTLFAPNNTAMRKFYDEIVKGYYPSVEALPQHILSYFINSQTVPELVWPKGFSNAMNAYGDYVNGAGQRGQGLDKSVVTDIRPASNGFFYGSDDYIKSHFFETVYTEILLNRSYSLAYNAIDKYFSGTLLTELTKCALNGYPDEDFTILLPSDELLEADGFRWEYISTQSNTYGFQHTYGGNTVVFADDRIQRLIRSHIFKRIKDTRITDFSGNPSGAYGGYAYAVNDYGDLIRYKDGKVQMLGNYDADDRVTVTPLKTFSNGQVFTIDKLLQYSICTGQTECSEKDMSEYIRQAAIDNPDVSKSVEYWEYILNSGQFNFNKTSFWTLLLPNNDAIAQAIANGHLRPLSAIISEPYLLTQAIDFFRYHLIPGTVYADDGYNQVLSNSGKAFPSVTAVTSLKIGLDNALVKIDKVAGRLRFSSFKSANVGETLVVPGETHSNLFGAKAVLHEIDNYLFYEPVK
jgi:uncharacterized surface protein with fasciclin (FAS1) repeats